MQNYFELFSIDVGFSIDLVVLESAYQQQIAKYHPDKFATHSDREKSLALQNTSLINTAFETLRSPLLRATYLLELEDINAFDEKDTHMDVAFLMRQIELREQLESIESNKDELELDELFWQTNKPGNNIPWRKISETQGRNLKAKSDHNFKPNTVVWQKT